VLVAMSLFYIGGMYLNDFFDRTIDAQERPERPIPSRQISAPTVGVLGFAWLAGGLALMAMLGAAAALAGLLLLGVIVGYDRFHKGNPAAPIFMGACRALVYSGAAAAAVGNVPAHVVVAALALLAYTAGITYAARQESQDHIGSLLPLFALTAPLVVALPALQQGVMSALLFFALLCATARAIYLLSARPMAGAVSRAVACLIAGISLIDAAFLASTGAILPGVIAAGGFGLTLGLHRYITGT
jgi:4-hydroxybenzoate polyprenyltransferase